MSKFYLTTPLYYVNASPHIGHAYTNIISDCVARFRRLEQDDVFFLTGTDEHGEKIKKAAEEADKEPQEFVDSVVINFKELWKKLYISYDDFIRTTQKSHTDIVQKVIKILFDKGDIYKSKYRGFYCVPCESFWTESQVKEADGCPGCRRSVEEIIEENYFFRLSKYEGWLKNYLKENPNFIKPRIRYNEVVGFLENNALEDLCISRPKKRVSWGIEFPLDNNFVVYVWFDALLNYISALKFGTDDEKFNKWWPADIQFIGKDILRHHAIFWPIMLHALGITPPHTIFAHGWWKMDEAKISKSRGNIVNPLELIKIIGVDALRYFLLREVPIGMDGNYSWSVIVNRINSDLANDLGNLVFRVLNMAEKYFQGKVGCPKVKVNPPEFHPFVSELDFYNNYVRCMNETEFTGALGNVWAFINTMNKYIEDKKPWVLKKEGKTDDLQHLVWSLLQGVRIVSIYIYPFMPSTTSSILRQLGKTLDRSEGLRSSTRWATKTNFEIKKEVPLFPRIDVD